MAHYLGLLSKTYSVLKFDMGNVIVGSGCCIATRGRECSGIKLNCFTDTQVVTGLRAINVSPKTITVGWNVSS